MSDALVEAIADMRDEEAISLAQRLLDGGTPPLDVLEDCRAAMTIVGRRFEDREYFIPELILAGETLRSISEIVKPRLTGSGRGAKSGRIVLGTVQGDIHDIGKDIVSFMLDVNGFEVFDLGVDVPPESFVESVRETRSGIVALSGFLTLSFDSMRETVDALEKAGLRAGVKVMIGGGTVDDNVREYARADAYGATATDAVNLARRWTAEAAGKAPAQPATARTKETAK
ncbi:MAG TPA: cobalamin-dependent protein [Streptosporangiaceae bacterium]|nr:cobalamin-dependent protein [Streptosporangiaceae bacterium]